MENLEMNLDFWQGKRVFVTGHTGFKGSWLCLWLQALGAKVTGFALPPNTTPNLFTVADVAKKMTSVFGDIKNFDAVKQAMDAADPEIILHLAAQPLVRYSYRNPVETYATNVMGTVHVLEAARTQKSVKSIVSVTSDKCYENKEWPWGYRENEPMGGYDPYSNSKGCAELVSAAYRSSYMNPENYAVHGIGLATARAGNVIGGGDWSEDRLVPDILRAIIKGEPVKIRSPRAIRPWQHVLEPINGYMLLAQKLHDSNGEYAEAWNFGPDDSDARNVAWITQLLVDEWGQGARFIIQEDTSIHEANYLKLDCSKAKTNLNWHAKWNAEIAISRIVDWHKAHINNENMHTYCLNEIADYQNFN